MQFVINSKVQVIVLGFTAVIRLVISSFWLRYVIKMENSDILISCLSKLSVIEMENSDISRMFQICSLKETTNPEYIEKFISELYPEWTSLLDSFWTLLL
jgi:ABC-type iron transport system FetAB permease component